MKKLQLVVYLILIAGFVMAYNQGFDSAKRDAMNCAYDDGAPYNFYNEHLYWKNNIRGADGVSKSVCCKYALVNSMIEEVCNV